MNDHRINTDISIFATLTFEQYAGGDWYSMTYL